MKANRILLAVLLIISGIASADDGGGPKDQPAKFKFTTKRKDDTVVVQANKEKTLFIIKSPFGISQAVIERESEKWPDAVVSRLHLKGLENFRASNGKVTINAAAGIQDGRTQVPFGRPARRTLPWT